MKYNNLSSMKCYNCQIELTPDTNHIEHIPAKNLFSTYPDQYKKNLLTVPACYKCNIELYSKIDQEIRDAIGILNESDDLKKALTEKAVRSIMRKSNWKDRLFFIEEGKSIKVTFDYENFKSLHIKNFKGLFYNKYGKPITSNYEISTISEGDEKNQKLQEYNEMFRNELEKIDYEIVGHPKVFKYKIMSLTDNGNGLFVDNKDISKAIGFVCTMEYHETIKPLVLALKTDFINFQ